MPAKCWIAPEMATAIYRSYQKISHLNFPSKIVSLRPRPVCLTLTEDDNDVVSVTRITFEWDFHDRRICKRTHETDGVLNLLTSFTDVL